MIENVIEKIIAKTGSFEALGKNMFYEFSTDRLFRKEANNYVLIANYQQPVRNAYQIPTYQLM